MKKTWIPVLSTLGAALLLSSCAADVPADADAASEDAASEESSSGSHEAEQVVAEADGEESHTAPEAVEAGSADAEAQHPGGQQIIVGPDGVEFFYVSAEEDDGTEVFHLHCQDEEALAAKAAHNDGAQPAGWPEDWDDTGAMPDPLCHPDYLQIDEWEYLEAHTACWEGIETSTLVRNGQSQEAVDRDLWHQSRARADWEPNPADGTCEEQWAENDAG